MISPFKCPMCSEALQLQGRTFKCINNHCFDMAKEGYVNLHLVQNKKSKNPGDSDEMIKSRREFLNAGFYQSLIDSVIEKIKHHCSKQDSVIDIGCGEGYYLDRIAKNIVDSQLAGIDISKSAVRLAAKRKMAAELAVASAYDLPFFEDSFDCALSIFSPYDIQEVSRVLKKDGCFIVVGPAKNHLRELAEFIYEKPIDHQGNLTALEKQNQFTMLEQYEVNSRASLTGSELYQLLLMTPYYWSCSEEKQAKLKELETMDVSFNFLTSIYRKVS